MSPPIQSARWYDLFSRGARDWLRHNEKVREAVRGRLPELIGGADVLTRPGGRIVQVPVRLLEHAHFRLLEPDERLAPGQGEVGDPGTVLRRARAHPGRGEKGAGSEPGELSFVLEVRVDDILDWLWEELELPHLEPRAGADLEEPELVREGLDRRGPRSRLDRRRTLREAVKRRAAQAEPLPFTDDDLRYRRVTERRRHGAAAVVIFALDCSASMDEAARRLAKGFFFWALQGLRRRYARIEVAFIAHTVEAWEFSEEEFFSVRGAGGTEASHAARLAGELLAERYDPARYNAYLLYASDGHNFPADRAPLEAALAGLARRCNLLGYLEIGARPGAAPATETARIFARAAAAGAPVECYAVREPEEVFEAIRGFFTRRAAERR